MNGNGQSTGDAWNGTIIRIPGIAYVGDIEPTLNDASLDTLDYTVGSIALGGLIVLAIIIIKD